MQFENSPPLWPKTANGTSRHSTQNGIKPLVSPWTPMTNAGDLKVLGKALEEFGEGTSAIARCLIQGINECEPVTGKPNLQWLQEELADVRATSRRLIDFFMLDEDFIEDRALKKETQLKSWQALPTT